jgi:hypothetical protein
MTNRKDAKAWLKIGIFSALLLLIIGYSAFQARKIIAGPDLTITSPTIEGIMTDPYIQVTGVAKNIKEISLNGRPIYIDEQGNFNERLVLIAGYNIIELEAKDKFNKETKKTIELVYQG